MPNSIIKPHIQQLAGSGNSLKHLVIERCFEAANTEYPSDYKPPSRHLIVAPATRQAALSWTRDGTGARVRSDFGPGDLILNPRGCSAHCQWGQDTQLILVAIDPSSVPEICGELEVPIIEVPKLFHFKDGAIHRTTQRLISCFETTSPPLLEAQTLERMLIRQVIDKCRKIYEKKHPLSKVKLIKVHDFIHDRLAATITIDDLASVAGYSPSRFLVLFRNATGFSPHQYVMQQRLERARELILRTDLPINAIAAECGFSDQSHLIRLFKRHTGFTPNRFRK
ncbi:AraC family transcriptional regulator [Luteolibacter luteus]|uniref:Helix-turn-helix transcriptional regulator n=1 Tax=Luteolibacter luteus TaxID=2728835 RepID=A0A858RDH8_9BACT|nr:AraC family transcriptional regulator [Luteolibacter luteus]QJE94370.1 helix-turn-helix transcriptional regulator [Luteolibacter luteus]